MKTDGQDDVVASPLANREGARILIVCLSRLADSITSVISNCRRRRLVVVHSPAVF